MIAPVERSNQIIAMAPFVCCTATMSVCPDTSICSLPAYASSSKALCCFRPSSRDADFRDAPTFTSVLHPRHPMWVIEKRASSTAYSGPTPPSP